MTLEDSGGGDVVTAAMAHLCASVQPRLLLSGFLVGEMVTERIAAGAPTAENGVARLPVGPGLGVDVDEAALGEPLLRFE
jgi:L-alanine-DL-glutamate epimerase-like enolase superfamily enzyme